MVNILKITEFCTLRGTSYSYKNYISIKLLYIKDNLYLFNLYKICSFLI